MMGYTLHSLYVDCGYVIYMCDITYKVNEWHIISIWNMYSFKNKEPTKYTRNRMHTILT